MKKLFKKLLLILNLHIDDNQKWIISWVFVFGLINTYISPAITKEIVSNLPAEFIAAQSLTVSLSGFIIGIIWKGKLREKAIKYFELLIATESILAFLIGMYLTFASYSVWLFAISNVLYVSLISIFIGKCLMAFRGKLWAEKEREIYDNNNAIVGGITCILGFGLSILFMPSIKTAIFIWACCCLLDNIGWGIVYWKNRHELRNI